MRNSAVLRRARLGDDADDLGNHVAGAAQEDAVALAHVLAPDFLLVVAASRAPR